MAGSDASSYSENASSMTSFLFIIDHEHKLFYYRGLKEYTVEKGYLMDTCLSAQDEYEKTVFYFYPDLSESVQEMKESQ